MDIDKLKDKINTIIREPYFVRGTIVVLSIIILVSMTCVQRAVVRHTSMEPTYKEGEKVLVNKAYKLTGKLERFDVIVINNNGKLIIKRIIGMPGERVRIDYDSNIYIDDYLLYEHYGRGTVTEPGNAADGIRLRTGEYFVLGDNRMMSLDSRSSEVGIIKEDDIFGKVIAKSLL